MGPRHPQAVVEHGRWIQGGSAAPWPVAKAGKGEMRTGGLLALNTAQTLLSPTPLSAFGLVQTPPVLWDGDLGLFGGFRRELVISGTAQTDWNSQENIKPAHT